MTAIRPTQRMASVLLGLTLQSLLSEAIASDDAKATYLQSDAQVIDSLKPWLVKMHKSQHGVYNEQSDKGLSDFVSQTYFPSAVLQVSDTPAWFVFAEAGDKVARFPNFRGEKEIGIYFQALQKAIRKAGCADFKGYEKPREGGGDLEPRIFVVSDTEAVIAGKFTYLLGNGITLECEILSETWVNDRGKTGDPWKIRSAMYSWNVSDRSALEEILQVPANAAPTGESSGRATVDINGTMVATALSKLEDVSTGHSSTFLIVILVVASVAVLMEWRRRRKAAQWSSINTGGDVWLG